MKVNPDFSVRIISKDSSGALKYQADKNDLVRVQPYEKQNERFSDVLKFLLTPTGFTIMNQDSKGVSTMQNGQNKALRPLSLK